MKTKMILVLCFLVAGLFAIVFTATARDEEYIGYGLFAGGYCVQSQVKQWFLDNRPQDIWQMDSIFEQIERYWLEEEMKIVGIFPMGQQECVGCCENSDNKHAATYDYSRARRTSSEDVVLGGPRLEGADLQWALELFQSLNPYVIALEEIALGDGTYIYAPIYAEGYDPVVFSGSPEEFEVWAKEEGKPLDFWELGRDECSAASYEFECGDHHHESLIAYILPTVKYVTLADGTQIFFSIVAGSSTNCNICRNRGRCIAGNWSSISSVQHATFCTCCHFQMSLQTHSFSYNGQNASVHRRSCAACGFFANFAHTFGSWTSVGNYQCQRACTRCGWAAMQNHSWELVSSNAQHAHFRCRSCGHDRWA